MKIIQKVILAWIIVVVVGATLPHVEVEAAGRTYVQYCTGSVTSPRCTWGYQDDIEAARERGDDFMREIRSLSQSSQENLLDKLVMRLALYHRNASNAYDQVITSYYHDYFKAQRDGATVGDDVDNIIARLIGTTSTSRYTYSSSNNSNSPRYADTPDNGKITAVTSANRNTTIRSSRITSRYGDLGLKITAKEWRDILNDDDGVRVVAVLQDGNYEIDTVAANDNGSYWSLTLSDQFDRVDKMTVYLLCNHCDSGSTFQGSLFHGWKVLDSERYTVSITASRNTRNDRYDDDYSYHNNNDDYDLEVSDVSYRYDGNGRDVDVQIETTVENIWSRDNTLESLSYTVELDGRRLSTSRYDIDHIRTDCDDNWVDRDDTRNLPMDEDDECEITVEFTFDQDEVEDEYLEITVEAEARRDDNTRNNEESVRFYVR